jgi:4-hydroxy-tetrahydrodipicolinate synthase
MKCENKTLGGVVVPMVTPVDEFGYVDFHGLEILVEWLLGKGIDGIFVAGTTGRFSYFSPAQNAEVCRVVSEVAGSRITVYGGCCDSGLHRVLANAELMQKAGADVIVTTASYYLACKIEEAEADLEKVADRSPLPVIIYNIPQLVGYGLRPEWLEEMAGHPNMVGYKDSTNDIDHHLEVLKRTEKKDFCVMSGKELLLYKAFKAGSKGVVSSISNVFPEPFVDMVNHVKASNWEAVEECQTRIAKIVEDCAAKRKVITSSSLMHYMEQELHLRGIDLKLF